METRTISRGKRKRMVGRVKIYAGRSQEISDRERHHQERLRDLAAQGMVLLENDGTLPFPGELKKIALFGEGARRTIKGGTGSGDVNVRKSVSIEEGLLRAGYEITTMSWLDRYEQIYERAYEQWGEHAAAEIRQGAEPMSYLMDKIFSPPPAPEITEEDIRESAADTVIYVISRNSGEGRDRHNIPGDYQLSEKEKRDLLLLSSRYTHMAVLLNIGGVIDMEFIRHTEGIGAVLLMNQGGSSGGDAAADIITGKVNPSGHLTDTWAKRYEDYPYAEAFSHNRESSDDVYYKEGIYVGYRYFDTFHIEPTYCFGYGKSYTTFQIQDIRTDGDEQEIIVTAQIKNTGGRAGREVLQVYYTAPAGKLEKPYQELAGFAKTKLLLPGETQTVKVHFETAGMASYCEKLEAWILEAGSYLIRAGFSSRDTLTAGAFYLGSMVMTARVRNQFPADDPFEELGGRQTEDNPSQEEVPETSQAEINRIILRKEKFKTKVSASAEEYPVHQNTDASKKLTLEDVKRGTNSLDELIGQLSAEELSSLCVGKIQNEISVIGNAGQTVPGAAGDTTDELWEERKIPSIVMADGPAGLRLTKIFFVDEEGRIGGGFDFDVPECLAVEMQKALGKTTVGKVRAAYYQYCSALPIETLMAQSWDMQVIEECSSIVGREMQEFGVQLWLAPGMNIHRNPLGGRNFEYYSEDPLLTGKCASASVRGVQKYEGTGAVIKHLAANNQESNRNYQNSHVNERALREIYLKGFEICVKESKPVAIMTSYNLLNGIHTANNTSLLTDVVRNEWGFKGMIMTDWGTTVPFGHEEHRYPISSPTECIHAGNDLIMPGTKTDRDAICKAAQEPGISRMKIAELQNCAKNIIKTIMKLQIE